MMKYVNLKVHMHMLFRHFNFVETLCENFCIYKKSRKYFVHVLVDMDENKIDSKKANLLIQGRKIVGRLSTLVALQSVHGGTIDSMDLNNEHETATEAPTVELEAKKSRRVRESPSTREVNTDEEEGINSQEQCAWIQAINIGASGIDSLTSVLVDTFDFDQRAHWRVSPVSIASLNPLGFAIYFGNIEAVKMILEKMEVVSNNDSSDPLDVICYEAGGKRTANWIRMTPLGLAISCLRWSTFCDIEDGGTNVALDIIRMILDARAAKGMDINDTCQIGGSRPDAPRLYLCGFKCKPMDLSKANGNSELQELIKTYLAY
jgi:hypothetical protein